MGKNLRVGVCEILCVRMWRVESVYGFLVCECVCMMPAPTVQALSTHPVPCSRPGGWRVLARVPMWG